MMFDRYYRTQAPNYPQRVTITENRAPTDESVKLLREMQEAAEKNRIESFKLESNDFHGVVEISQEAFNTARASSHFKINSKAFSVSVAQEMMSPDWRIDLMHKLKSVIADKIAGAILSDMMKGATHD